MRRAATALLALASCAAAQTKGSLAGYVHDPFGGPIQSAVVRVKDAKSGAAFRGSTGKDGRFMVAEVPAGTYDIVVNVPSMKPFERKGVTIAAATSAPTNIDVAIEEAPSMSTLGEDYLHTLEDQKRHKPPAGPTPRTADGKPDFSGVWWQAAVADPGRAEWTAYAQKVSVDRDGTNTRPGYPRAFCLPSAILHAHQLFGFVQSRELLVVLTADESPGFRQVYIGKEQPKDPNPSWFGHSVARWDGDMLVVDRVGFDDRVWVDNVGHPATAGLHVTERYRRPDLGHLEIEITMEDPKVLAKPWTQKKVADLAPGEVISEYICNENNSYAEHVKLK